MIHLHTHSMYSILDGLGKPKDIVAKAKALGASAVAITDHASISCLTDLMKEAKAAGIKPIAGCEFYWVDDANILDKSEVRNHLTVWAKNWNGVLSIMEKLTIANQQFYKRPRLSWEQCFDFKDCIVGTACTSGVLIRDDYNEKVEQLKAVYGDDLYLEVMPYSIKYGEINASEIVNIRALQLWRKGFNTVMTCDAHYVEKEDQHTHEVLLAIQTGANWDDPKRWRLEVESNMASVREIMERIGDIDYFHTPFADEMLMNAIVNTQKIADKVNIEMPKYEVALPSPYEECEEEAVFGSKLIEGWTALIDGKVERMSDYRERLIYELEVIKRLGFRKYFLIVEDIINWARNQGIMVGCARGSSAGSLVCYLLGITQIDPLKHGLYFERFLNPERIDLPDIDVDFQDDRRDEVFAYIKHKYGTDRTAHINTYGQLTVKSAFRDVCRVFGINNLKVNMLSKLIGDEESFEKVPELVNFGKHNPDIIEQAKKLAGTIRQVGVHACGFLVSSKPLNGVSVLERRKDARVVNWDKDQAEKFGLVKIDILGLSTLTILNMAKNLIKKNRGVDIEFTEIPLNDELTLEGFAKGEGIGVFQFENSGMQGLLKSLNIDSFETIADATALFRPGSLNSGQTETYVKIAKGDEYESYLCEQLRPILSPTKGVMVYQEQIMQIFNQLAGFTWAEADKMRKIIGKKLGKDEFEKHREHFSNGCEANGIDRGISATIFDKMIEFAAYSFNKSHAVAYSVISFWCMYLKVRYPLEFLAAQLSYSANERVPVIVKEANRLGIMVDKPDINKSGKTYITDVESNRIIAPLGCIKGIGEKAVDAVLRARGDGAFLTIDEFRGKVERRIVNVRVVETLVRAGCFEGLLIYEPDEEKRHKNYSELLPIYNVLPSLPRVGNPLLKDILVNLFGEMKECGKRIDKTMIPPKAMGAKPPVLVINNPVKGEMQHLISDASKCFLKVAKEIGMNQSCFYYTSPLKCIFNKVADAPKECQTKCMDFLKNEIQVVKPKLILCFASNALKLFGLEENMRKAHGQVFYSREFDCYVLPCYSPQYAYFNEDIMEEFLKGIDILRQIFF